MMKTIQTTEEMEQMIDACSTKSILENDLTVLQNQLKQIKFNIDMIKCALGNPETEAEFRAREEKKEVA